MGTKYTIHSNNDDHNKYTVGQKKIGQKSTYCITPLTPRIKTGKAHRYCCKSREWFLLCCSKPEGTNGQGGRGKLWILALVCSLM